MIKEAYREYVEVTTWYDMPGLKYSVGFWPHRHMFENGIQFRQMSLETDDHGLPTKVVGDGLWASKPSLYAEFCAYSHKELEDSVKEYAYKVGATALCGYRDARATTLTDSSVLWHHQLGFLRCLN